MSEQHRHEWRNLNGVIFCGAGSEEDDCPMRHGLLTADRANALERVAEAVRFMMVMRVTHPHEAKTRAKLNHPNWADFAQAVQVGGIPVWIESFEDWLQWVELAALDAADA